MEAWPTTLPTFNYGVSYTSEPNVIRSENAVGPYNARRRFTAAPTTVRGTLSLSTSQVSILDTFVEATLKDVLPFTMLDHRTGTVKTFVFTKRPEHSPVGHNNWSTSVELRSI